MSALRLAAVGLALGGFYWWWTSGRSRYSDNSSQVTLPTLDLGGLTLNLGNTGSIDLGITSTGRRPPNNQYTAMIEAAAKRHGVPDDLLLRQAERESGFRPNAHNAQSGAHGMFQFMPATAKEWGVDVNDPASSADGAARYMVWLYKQTGSWKGAAQAYNWGIGYWKQWRAGKRKMPEETRIYGLVVADGYTWAEAKRVSHA